MKVYTICVSGLMTEEKAKTIANVAQAVCVTADITVSLGEWHPDTVIGPVLKPKSRKTERW